MRSAKVSPHHHRHHEQPNDPDDAPPNAAHNVKKALQADPAPDFIEEKKLSPQDILFDEDNDTQDDSKSVGNGDQERPQDILFRRRTSQFFFVTNLFHICFGIGSLIIIRHYANLDHQKLEPFFYYLQMYHDIIALAVCVSAVIHVLAGIIGLMWTNCCKCLPCHPIKLFSSYENFLNVILALNIGASLVVAVIGARPVHKMLDDVMLTEAYHWSHHPKFNKTHWEKVHTITRLQRELHCCGLHDFRDWYFSPGHFIPESCCDNTRLEDCKNALHANDVWNTGSSRNIAQITPTRMREIRTNVGPFLWPRNCMEALQAEVTHIRIRWAVIICTLILCQTFLFGWSSFLSRYIRIHLQYEKDVQKMIKLRAKLKLWDSFREAHFGEDGANNLSEVPSVFLGIRVPETPQEQEAEKIYEKLHQRRETMAKAKAQEQKQQMKKAA